VRGLCFGPANGQNTTLPLGDAQAMRCMGRVARNACSLALDGQASIAPHVALEA
jgi:hypothetical protein